MKTHVSARLALALVIACLAACSKPDSPTPAAVDVQATARAQPAPAERSKPSACSMVSQEQMSVILGMAVVAVPNESSNGVTECVYTAASSISPDAKLTVEWGEGQAAMSGVALANQAEPGITDSLDGLGDEAAQVGPVLFIHSGDDLVKIYLTGVSDVVPPAQKILELVKAKL